jgi:integrase
MDSIRKPKVQEQLPLFYTREEYNKLISVIDNKDIKDLIVVAVNTGLRQMELLTLQWSQVNFEDKLLILDNQNFVSKSKKIRSIPLNTTTMNILLKRNNNMNSSYVFTYNDQPIKY